jgi:SAM-dependent methyltransferase
MESERNRGWRSLLTHPVVYEAVQTAVGARRWLRKFVQESVRPKAGDRILDIGCGPGELVRYLPPVDYCGFDYSEDYIAHARERFGDRARFFHDDVAHFGRLGLGPFDVVVAIGVLHHLDDRHARALFALAHDALDRGGRLITADPCYHNGQPAITRFIVSQDRGAHVRHFEEYATLARNSFPTVSSSLDASLFPFPHSVCVLHCEAKV